MARLECSDLLPDDHHADGDVSGELTAERLATWWTTLDDPILAELIQEGLEGSLDMKSAKAVIREAQARLGIARAGLFPQIDASGQYSRSRSSANMTPQIDQPSPLNSSLQSAATAAVSNAVNNALGISGGSGGSPTVSEAGTGDSQSMPLEGNYYQAGLDATWEIDVFGGTRRSVEAANATLLAQEENLKAVWVSLAAEIALSYVDVRSAQRRLEVAEKNLAAQTDTLELLTSRLEAGLADELAVQQARYNVERTRATIPTFRTSLENSMNTLAVLTGTMPGTLHERLAPVRPIPVGSLKLVTGIPANALRQRPDIRVAERRLAAQAAQIGVATADLYPRFFLLGSIGWESLESSTFMSSHSKAWSLSPRVSWPIFHGGSIRSNIEAQKALHEQLLATYEKTVLIAAQEVRDALAAFAQEQRRRDTILVAIDAAQAAEEIAQDKYKSGLTDFNNVLDAQRSLFSFEESLAVSEAGVTANLVRLYKALGGGWQSMDLPSEVSTEGHEANRAQAADPD
jgi:NodT family efflux transporter outer membrane factor (OMF) lipoprotein